MNPVSNGLREGAGAPFIQMKMACSGAIMRDGLPNPELLYRTPASNDRRMPESRGVHSVLISIALGIVLLVAGRRLFWLFVAAVGFLYGLNFAPLIFHEGSELLYLIVALACGIAGALLGVLAQKVAVAIAGGLLGGYFASEAFYGIEWHHHIPTIAFIIGAIVGAVLVLMLFDWALIIWSSIAGSILITHSFRLTESERDLLFLALAILGIAVQAGLLRRQRSLPAPPVE
jgi:hypothetical protein